MPQISWLARVVSPIGVSETGCIYAVIWAYLASLVLLGLGFHSRVTAFGSWLLHWTLMNTGFTTTYGVDLYAHVFLFYLIFVPAGDAWSMDVLSGRRDGSPSTGARIGLRILQLHLCISYPAAASRGPGTVVERRGDLAVPEPARVSGF